MGKKTFYNVISPSTSGDQITLTSVEEVADFIANDLKDIPESLTDLNHRESLIITIISKRMTQEEFDALGEFQF